MKVRFKIILMVGVCLLGMTPCLSRGYAQELAQFCMESYARDGLCPDKICQIECLKQDEEQKDSS